MSITCQFFSEKVLCIKKKIKKLILSITARKSKEPEAWKINQHTIKWDKCSDKMEEGSFVTWDFLLRWLQWAGREFISGRGNHTLTPPLELTAVSWRETI